jgi:hypothetical protein
MKVEVSHVTKWLEGEVVEKRGEWVLVNYPSVSAKEWVEPWRIRKVGSTEDLPGRVTANRMMRGKLGDPPREIPGPPPWEGLLWDGKWGMVPDGVAAVKEALPASVPLMARDEDFEEKAVTVSAGDKPVVWISHAWQKRGTHEKGLTLERVDVSSKKSVVFKPEGGLKFLDASPDGTSVLLMPRTGSRGGVELWTVTDGKLERASDVKPFESRFGGPQGAFFTDEGNILVIGSFGKPSLWDMKTKAYVYQEVELGKGLFKDAVMSPGRKYLAITSQSVGVSIIEVKTGKRVGEMPRSSERSELAFSPSGKQLVSFGGYGIEVWDMTTGKQWRQFMVDAPPRATLSVPVDGYALVGGLLVDLEKRVVVWKYPEIKTDPGVVIEPGTVTFATNGSLKTVKVAGEAERAVSKGVDAEGILMIKPGMKVSVEVSVPAPEGEKVKELLLKSLAKAGIEVAEGQRVKLVLRRSEGKREEKDYRIVGSDPANPMVDKRETATSVEQISVFGVEVDGKMVWERKTAFQPQVYQLEKDQTVASALEEASKMQSGNLYVSWMPAYWVRPGAVVVGGK